MRQTVAAKVTNRRSELVEFVRSDGERLTPMVEWHEHSDTCPHHALRRVPSENPSGLDLATASIVLAPSRASDE